MDKSKDHSDSTRRVVVIEKVFFFLSQQRRWLGKKRRVFNKSRTYSFWPQLFKQWIALSTGLYITIQWITELVFVLLNRWIAIYGLGCSKAG